MIQNCSESYSNIIFISLWKDYNKIDLEEYLKLSKEYLSIDTQENKKGFIQYRMDELLPEKNFKIWKDNNTSYALGLILNGIRNFGGKFQVVDIDKIHPEFKNELAVLQNPLLQQQYAIFI
ncbi:hypothetical protein [Flavobacterium pectinovorum]|uniref:hypothetical protein n=1 Tax=Flavobacterium pectinovorum TaxID=29533 RepID=UPI001FAC6F6F|nr:hypothetical protein [Flavobacterium pectinovorum]MCI9845476.1 hypothetical protein [Flavobacterium pectinovorum]